MELQVVKQVNPLIEWNKEEIKKRVGEELKKYKGLVFTEDTAKEAKATRSELNNLIKDMKNTAIKIDKEMSKDIKEFRSEVNEVIALVTEVVEPIDAQVKVFEQAKKDKKRDEVNELIATIVKEYGLDEKHAAQLTITDKYLNASEKIPKITTDLKNRAEILKVAQTTVEKSRELVIDTCKMYENQATLDVNAYLKVLDSGRDSGEVVADIHRAAKRQIEAKQEAERQRAQAEFEAQQRAQREAFEAEQRAREEAMRAEYEAKQTELQKQAEEPVPEPIEHVEPMKLSKEVQAEPLTTWEIRITAHDTQWKLLGKVLKQSGMKYEFLKEVIDIEEAI